MSIDIEPGTERAVAQKLAIVTDALADEGIHRSGHSGAAIAILAKLVDVAFERIETLERADNYGPDEFVVNVTGWDRWPEVVAYALNLRIDTSTAIKSLVNSGLSHL